MGCHSNEKSTSTRITQRRTWGIGREQKQKQKQKQELELEQELMASIPLQRSKAWLEAKGWHVWITEHWNSWAHIRQDMYGLIDLVAIRHDSPGVWGINACEDNGQIQAHVDKYLNGYVDIKKGKTYGASPHLPVWLSAGNRFSLFGWGKRSESGRGSRKVWTLRLVEFYLEGPEVKWREVAQVDA